MLLMLLTLQRLFKINKLRDFKTLSSSWFESMPGSQISNFAPGPGLLLFLSITFLVRVAHYLERFEQGDCNTPSFQVAFSTTSGASHVARWRVPSVTPYSPLSSA